MVGRAVISQAHLARGARSRGLRTLARMTRSYADQRCERGKLMRDRCRFVVSRKLQTILNSSHSPPGTLRTPLRTIKGERVRTPERSANMVTRRIEHQSEERERERNYAKCQKKVKSPANHGNSRERGKCRNCGNWRFVRNSNKITCILQLSSFFYASAREHSCGPIVKLFPVGVWSRVLCNYRASRWRAWCNSKKRAERWHGRCSGGVADRDRRDCRHR